jgi:radical SAM superfamily enzyme YgiQ (UPF0313 family)
MNTILFTHAYFLRFDPKQWRLGQPYPPLGTLYAAALIRENQFKVAFVDMMFASGPSEIEAPLKQIHPEILVICDDGFNYLTKMCLTNMRYAAFRMIELAKDSGCKVIVSSSDSTDRYQEYLERGADFVIIGEAEQTLLELIKDIHLNKEDYTAINGVAFKANGKAIKTPGRPVLKNLDPLPLPAWDLVDMDLYRQKWLNSAGYFSINMSTTRGCPFKCNWCAKPIYGNRYNSRSPQHVVSEIKLLTERYHIDHIWFCDDIFGLKPGWVSEFARLMVHENISIRFKIQSRADLLSEPETVEMLALSGCENAWIGAESGSQKILDAMDKGITVDQITGSTGLMKANGIKPSFFIQFGYPGETQEDISLTVDMINRLLPFEIGISVSYPLPGTLFFEKVKAELKEKTNWTDSDEMALMFHNTFPPAYYKQLHRYVHKNYRKHLAKSNFLNLFRKPFKPGLMGFKQAVLFCYYTPLTFMEKLRLKQLENAG